MQLDRLLCEQMTQLFLLKQEKTRDFVSMTANRFKQKEELVVFLVMMKTKIRHFH